MKHSDGERPGLLEQATNLAKSAAQGAASVARTHILRQDRATDEEFAQRLSVCGRCPGGHARFKPNGEVHTCGPMLASASAGGGRKPCGCLLQYKARDVRESCPLGYWPAIERRPIEAPGLVAPALPRIVTAQQHRREMDRRRFLQSSAAVLAGAALLSRVQPARASENVYRKLTAACGSNGPYTHIAYSSSGFNAGDVIKAGDDCYTVGDCVVDPTDPNVAGDAAMVSGCSECVDAPCNIRTGPDGITPQICYGGCEDDENWEDISARYTTTVRACLCGDTGCVCWQDRQLVFYWYPPSGQFGAFLLKAEHQPCDTEGNPDGSPITTATGTDPGTYTPSDPSGWIAGGIPTGSTISLVSNLDADTCGEGSECGWYANIDEWGFSRKMTGEDPSGAYEICDPCDPMSASTVEYDMVVT